MPAVGNSPDTPQVSSATATIFRTSNLDRDGVTIAADPQLVLPVEANTFYRFEALLTFNDLYNDLEVGVGADGTFSDDWMLIQNSFSAATEEVIDLNDTHRTTHGGLLTIATVRIVGHFKVGSGGDFWIRWGQGDASGTGFTSLMYAGSYLTVTKA